VPVIKLPITVLIAAKNEALNIARCLKSLGPAYHTFVIDSHSTDATAAIACDMGAEVVQFNYTGGYPKKRQWALDTLNIDTEWVFLLDADEVVPDSLWNEIAVVVNDLSAKDAYLINKGFHFLGQRFIHGGFSHQAILLFRKGRASFEELINDPAHALDMEIHERLCINGLVGSLKTPLIHEDFKGLEAYISRHNCYSTWEARLRYAYLEKGRYGKQSIKPRLFGNVQERRRFLKEIAVRIPFESTLWFLYHYIIRLGIVEGRPGLIASQIRASYIAQVRAKMYELRRAQRKPYS
jgi:glycosyltransferase involved in cell wall biosynthesis